MKPECSLNWHQVCLALGVHFNIAKSAVSCPKCGAKNSYINSKIEEFIALANDPRFTVEIKYEYSGDILAGVAADKTQKISFILMTLGLIFQIPGLLLNLFVSLEISQMLQAVGVSLLAIGVVILIYKPRFSIRPDAVDKTIQPVRLH